jgi:hypothetical protein
MSKTADSPLVCAGPLVSVRVTGTNLFPVCRLIVANHRLAASGVQGCQFTSGVERTFRIWMHENSARFY